MSVEVLFWDGCSGAGGPGTGAASFPGDRANDSAPGCALTIGVFDGVHLGHQALIRTITRRGPHPTVITFTENPKKFFFPETYEGDILSPQQKMEIFGTLGVERVILIDFSLEFSKIKGGEFLQILQDRWHPVFMALGDNFRWGRHRDMDAGSIQRANRAKGIPTEIIPPVEIEGAPVSSSRIRAAILGGDLGLAERLLGRPWVPGTLAGPGRCLN